MALCAISGVAKAPPPPALPACPFCAGTDIGEFSNREVWCWKCGARARNAEAWCQRVSPPLDAIKQAEEALEALDYERTGYGLSMDGELFNQAHALRKAALRAIRKLRDDNKTPRPATIEVL